MPREKQGLCLVARPWSRAAVMTRHILVFQEAYCMYSLIHGALESSITDQLLISQTGTFLFVFLHLPFDLCQSFSALTCTWEYQFQGQGYCRDGEVFPPSLRMSQQSDTKPLMSLVLIPIITHKELITQLQSPTK